MTHDGSPSSPRREGAEPGSPLAAALAAFPAWAWGLATFLFALRVYYRAPELGFAGDDALVLYHVRRLGGLSNPWEFFTLDFFAYFRPLGFLTHAFDAWAWDGLPAGFHITNVLLHAVNGVLVFLLARRVMSLPLAGLAAALFVSHASNQEAVFWVSARFDVLATLFVLTAVLLTTRASWASVAGGALAFALALLSKEAALATPLIVGAYIVFVERATWRRTAIVIGALLATIGLYSVVRSTIGGLDPTGGASRLPKAVMLFGAAAGLVWLSRADWPRVVTRIERLRAVPFALVSLVLIGGLGAAALVPGRVGAIVREKLAFAGYAGYYLLSPIVSPAPPPYFLDPDTRVYWSAGLLVVAFVLASLFLLRRAIAQYATWLFILAAIAGALVPVLSLTDGQRYMYVPSIGVSLGLAYASMRFRGRWRTAWVTLLGALIVVSMWQVQKKADDWEWAGDMTAEAIAKVGRDLPACDRGDVVFLLAPVSQRGVYSHFYHQTFSMYGGCEPASYQAVARAVRVTGPVGVFWTAPDTVVLFAEHYQGNFVLSRDLRQFTIGLRATREASLDTPLGRVDARAVGDTQWLRLRLAPGVDRQALRLYVFGDRGVERVQVPKGPFPEGPPRLLFEAHKCSLCRETPPQPEW